jgi:SHS2 domain-containing protein
MKRFEWIEHPSDIGFRAYGRDLAEAFENAAFALFETIVDTSKVNPRQEVGLEITAEDDAGLLYDWLDRLIFHHDSKNMVFSKFKVEISKSPKRKLKGKIWGEPFDPARHPRRNLVKAVTYHLMEIKQEKNITSLQVVVDV